MTSKERNFIYSEQAETSIFLEEASEKNPYNSKKNYIHGYDVLDLASKKSFSETLLLLFTGELPTAEEARLISLLQVGFMNLGPRHPSVKAAMVAGVSKTNVEHLLPIGLSVAGGKENGACEVFDTMSFLQENKDKPISDITKILLKEIKTTKSDVGDIRLAPGFGRNYGGVDEFTHQLLALIQTDTTNLSLFPMLNKVIAISSELEAYNYGLLKTGLAAAVFLDIGISNRQAIGLFQLICAPGIFAHGVEQTHKPITSMPMPNDEQHIYQPKK